MPQVGKNAQPGGAVIDNKGHAVRAVVGRGDGLDTHLPELYRVPRNKMLHPVEPARVSAQPRGPERFFSYIQRDAELALIYSGAPHVIGVVMGNNKRGDVPDVTLMKGQARGRLLAADAGVEEQLHPACFDIQAVAVAPGLE